MCPTSGTPYQVEARVLLLVIAVAVTAVQHLCCCCVLAVQLHCCCTALCASGASSVYRQCANVARLHIDTPKPGLSFGLDDTGHVTRYDVYDVPAPIYNMCLERKRGAIAGIRSTKDNPWKSSAEIASWLLAVHHLCTYVEIKRSRAFNADLVVFWRTLASLPPSSVPLRTSVCRGVLGWASAAHIFPLHFFDNFSAPGWKSLSPSK